MVVTRRVGFMKGMEPRCSIEVFRSHRLGLLYSEPTGRQKEVRLGMQRTTSPWDPTGEGELVDIVKATSRILIHRLLHQRRIKIRPDLHDRTALIEPHDPRVALRIRHAYDQESSSALSNRSYTPSKSSQTT